MSDCMILSMNADEIYAHGPDRCSSGNRDRRSRALLRIARLLPLATVAAWIVTTFVPILDSGDSDGPRIRITSLGYSPLDPTDLDPGMVAVLVLILASAVLPWLVGASRWWSVAAFLIGVAVLMGLAAAVIDPPTMMWDGQTDKGMPAGGLEVARPTMGFVVCAIGSLALVAAGICGWIGRQRLKHRTQPW